jgi:hypothetical protein
VPRVEGDVLVALLEIHFQGEEVLHATFDGDPITWERDDTVEGFLKSFPAGWRVCAGGQSQGSDTMSDGTKVVWFQCCRNRPGVSFIP